MTDEGPKITTSEIAALLHHSSPAVTRDWIRYVGLEAKDRDVTTGEKRYLRADVEEKIASMSRGPRRGERQPRRDGPPNDHDRVPPGD